MSNAEAVVRYARPTDFDNNILNCTAFERSVADDDGLSVSRRHILHKSDDADILSLQIVLSSHRKLSKNGRLAQIGVTEIFDVGRQIGLTFDVVDDALPGRAFDGPDGKLINSGIGYENKAHALILNLLLQDSRPGDLQSEFVGDLLAGRVECFHPALP